MKAIFDLILGVVTSIGGFVEVGSISTSAQAGSEFGFQLLWAVALAGLILALLIEMSGRLAIVSRRSLAAAVRERFGIHFHAVPLMAELVIRLDAQGEVVRIEPVYGQGASSEAALIWTPAKGEFNGARRS